MKVYEQDNTVILEDIKDFNPKHIFECGQCFRWIKEDDESYTGVAKGRVINVSKQGDKVFLKNTNLDIINKIQANTVSEEEKNYNQAKVLINPVITNREGLTDYWEACASCLDNFGRVLRPYKIELEYYDVEGNKKQETFEGFESTVLSHEIDHLDGILHIDIAEEVYQMPAEERRAWRLEHGYKVYSKTGDYEVLRRENSKKKVLKKS